MLLLLGLFAAGVAIAFAIEHATGERTRPGRAPLPLRIIALPPSVAEALFALGAGDRVAGVGDFCIHPPEAKARPRCGGEFNPSFEQILVLRPDLIVVQGKAEKVEAFGRRYRVRVLHVDMDSRSGIAAGIRTLGEAIGRTAEAEGLVARIESGLAAVARRVAGRPRPKVFLCLGRTAGSLRGLSTAGRTSFLAELLAVAGGTNVFADVAHPYPTVSKEALLERAPEVIIELHPGEILSEAARRKLLADWECLASLPAVRTRRIHLLTDDSLLIPGPRIAKTAERFAEALHPDAKGEP